MMKRIWTPVLEMDDEAGTHTCYSTSYEDRFIWITQMYDDTWDVDLQDKKGSCTFTNLANCKTLKSAKAWVTRNLF